MTERTFPAGHDSKPKCGGKLKQAEGFCTRPAGWGTTHAGFGSCKLHGGSTKTQVISAERQRVQFEARAAVRKLGFEPIVEPYSQLQMVAGELVAVKDWLRGEVERLEEIRYRGGSGEQIRGELLAYQTALRDTVNVLTAMARLRVDEQLVRIEEKKAAIMVAAVEAGLAEIGIAGPDAFRAKQAIARHLRVLPPSARDGA